MNIPETISFIRDLYGKKEDFIPLHAPTFAGNEKKYLDLYNRNYEKLVVYKTQKVEVEKEKAEKYIKESDILMFLSSSTFKAFADSINLSENEEIKEIMKFLNLKTCKF